MTAEPDGSEDERPPAVRNRRRITIAIGLAAVVLVLAGVAVVDWYLKAVCEVRVVKAELVGDRCHIRLEVLSRVYNCFHTLQRDRSNGQEKKHAWMVGTANHFIDDVRFRWKETLNLRIPLAETDTLEWHIQPGSRFRLRPGDELPILSGRVRGGSGDADIDYFIRAEGE